jgi:hypothetical protein
MTTAFVLGGGGLLGAHEVGMLRALSEVGIQPDLVVGTSVGAINGAFIAADPSGAAGRLIRLWQGDELRLAPRHPETGTCRAPRPGRAGPGHAEPPAAPAGRNAGRPGCLPGRRRDLRGARRTGHHLVVSDVWRRFPVDQVIRAKWWRVPSDQVPRAADHEAQVQWLYAR